MEYATDALPLSTQADLLSISRRSLYYQPKPPPPTEVAITQRIDEIYTAHPFYGSRKLTVLLEPDFAPINRKRVQRYMREMGIAGIAPGPNLSRRALEHRIYPYLLRGVTAQLPDHIWGCDITYIRLRTSWLYLVAILDWFSRYVVSWALDDTLEVPFVLEAVGQALRTATPQIWNTDQGSQFTSPRFTEVLKDAGVRISMDGRGRWMDNVFIERLWRSMKYECVYLHAFETGSELRAGLARWVGYYNADRPHSALGGRTPDEAYHTIEPTPMPGRAPASACTKLAA